MKSNVDGKLYKFLSKGTHVILYLPTPYLRRLLYGHDSTIYPSNAKNIEVALFESVIAKLSR